MKYLSLFLTIVSLSADSLRLAMSMKMPRRQRTAYNSIQIMQLEKEFKKNHYLDRQRREDLAKSIGLVERQVEVWFQNRRMKEKKKQRDSGPSSHIDSDNAPSPASSSRSDPSPGPPTITPRVNYAEQHNLMVNALASAMYAVGKRQETVPNIAAQQQLTQQLKHMYGQTGAGFYRQIEDLDKDEQSEKAEERKDSTQNAQDKMPWNTRFPDL